MVSTPLTGKKGPLNVPGISVDCGEVRQVGAVSGKGDGAAAAPPASANPASAYPMDCPVSAWACVPGGP